MKNLRLAFLAVIALVSFSCSDDDNSNPPVSDETYINFKVNGEQVNIEEPATITSLSALVSGMKGEGADMRRISLWMPVDVAAGTHTITESNPSDVTVYNASVSIGEDVSFDASAGTLTITSMGSEYMEGTFSFTGQQDTTTYTVTEGKFRAFVPAN